MNKKYSNANRPKEADLFLLLNGNNDSQQHKSTSRKENNKQNSIKK